MALYDCKCPACGWTGEIVKAMRDPYPACPGCGATLDKDWSRAVFATERQFYGSRETLSNVHSFHPDEVRKARRVLGPALRSDSQIGDDGSVRFSSRSEERAFSRRMTELRNQCPTTHEINRVNAAAKARRAGGGQTRATARR